MKDKTLFFIRRRGEKVIAFSLCMVEGHSLLLQCTSPLLAHRVLDVALIADSCSRDANRTLKPALFAS